MSAPASDRNGPGRLGSLRGAVHPVKTEDGVVLHAEINEVSPYISTAARELAATLVFVHGFTLTMDCWHFQRLAFRGKRRLVFFDQRSHGRSEISDPTHVTIDQLGKDLLEVMDTLAPHEPVILIGHSMGGMSIAALAEQHPELFGRRIVGVALISTTAGGLRVHKMLSRFIPDGMGRFALERGLLLIAQRDRLVDRARRGVKPISQRVVEEFAFGTKKVPEEYTEFVDKMIASVPLKILVQFIPQIDALDKFSTISVLARVPTLVMGGTHDKLIGIAHSRRLHAAIPGSHLVEFNGGGHMPILEFHDRVNEHLDRLFTEADHRIAEHW